MVKKYGNYDLDGNSQWELWKLYRNYGHQPHEIASGNYGNYIGTMDINHMKLPEVTMENWMENTDGHIMKHLRSNCI